MAKNCFSLNFTVPGDNAKQELHKVIEQLAGTNDHKSRVLASYFLDKAWIHEMCTKYKKENIININKNTLRRELRLKYEREYRDLSDLSAKINAESLNGFSSHIAKHLAIARTADMILRGDIANMDKPANKRKTKSQLLQDVVKSIVHDFETTVVNTLDRQLTITNPMEIEAIRNDIANINSEIIRLSKEYDAKSKDAKFNGTYTNIELRKIRNEASEKINDLIKRKILILQNVIDKYGTDRAKNFSNLVTQVLNQKGEWWTRVMEHPKARHFSRAFNEPLTEEEIAEMYTEDGFVVNEEDKEGLNQENTRMTPDNVRYRSYLQLVDDDIKLYLGSLYNLTSPEHTEKMENVDRDNELGVPTTMNAGEIICAITTRCSFTSIEDFIDSAEKLIKGKKSLYGVAELIYEMKNNRELANKYFCAFANPVVRKIMIQLTANGKEVINSNEKADPIVSLTYSLTNAAKSLIYNSFDIASSEEINNTLLKLQKYNNDYLLDHDDNTSNPARKEIRDLVVKQLLKYFPAIDINTIDSYLNSSNFGMIDRYKTMLSKISEFNKKAKTIVDKLNKNANNGIRNYSDINFEELNFPVREIVELLAPYSNIRIELNSPNAKGNMSSDSLANNQISNIIKQINYSNEESVNAGLEKLKDFITYEDGKIIPQYEYSPIFFGVYDAQGNELMPGLFIKNGNEITINPNAKNVIKCSLFDGIKDIVGNTGELYASMSKGDYFISNILAYIKPISKDHTYTKGFMKAGYMMRIPSDAPKNFIVHAPAISIQGLYNDKLINTDHGIFRGFKSHLFGEINTFIHNLNNVCDIRENPETGETELIVKDNISGLFETYHRKGNDIFKDGKFVGNVFSFNRLFNLAGKDYDVKIKEALSFYGVDFKVRDERNEDGTTNTVITAPTIVKKVGDKVVMSLNEEIISKLDNIVNEWISDFINEIDIRTEEYTALIQDAGINLDTVREAMLNTALAYMNFDDIFEGDSKFYKNAQDFLKRAKEVQAGGKSYGNYSLNDPLGGEIQDIIDSTKKDSKDNKVTYEIAGKTYVSRNGFKAITIKNTVRNSANIDAMRKELESQNVPANIIESILSKYKDTKTNDAQSYITIEEFAARKFADGTLSKYKPLLDKLMSDEDLTEEDYKAISKLDINIQVEKNFYFDKQKDLATGVIYPRQIKNAEFVLIPKFLPKNSSLMKLYNIMKQHGINQVNTAETDKAAKRTVLEFWDNDGNIVYDEDGKTTKLENALTSKEPIENYYYRYLYKQQSVSQHMVDEKNKAGIQIIKKIVDNANSYSENVQKHVERMTNNYISNIRHSFNQLMDKLGWQQTTDGRIINKDSNKELLDFRRFYDAAKQEAIRLGMDTNFLEYFKYDDSGIPIMPNFMNNVSSKIESIAQSIFNSAVTRQTLPGWHAAQITNVGYDKNLRYHEGYILIDSKNSEDVISDETYEKLSDEEKTKYIKAYYAEILLPKWNSVLKEMNDEEALKALQEAGLDEHIGYRIPTEGKQSVAILKVVGFLNDRQGSTVMVPDAWVAQTGSDFDVDSVYGICYEFYKNKDGKLVKYKLDEEDTEEATRRRYNTFVKRELRTKLDIESEFTEINERYHDTKDKIQEAVDKLDKAEKNADFEQLQGELKYYYTRLTDSHKKLVDSILSNKDKSYYDRVKKLRGVLAAEKIKIGNSRIKLSLTPYIATLDSLTEIIEATKAKNEAFKDFEEFKEWSAKERERIYNSKIDELAKENDIVEFDEFETWDILLQNTREARNNAILESMIEILKDSSTREENYSASNFADLSDAKSKIDSLRDTTIKERSVYNPFDQIDFMENAMSGARLKAKSVIRDTFNSVANYTKATLAEGKGITVEYDLTKTDNNGRPIYNLDNIKNSYSNYILLDKSRNVTENIEDAKYVRVYHYQLAHSNDNRNIVGSLVTTYSSQTTAHILDAIKEGAIYNENLYTFGCFKTLIDLGIDYETAIAFLQQPAISTIVRKYNDQKSIYTEDRRNPIKEAIVDIAKRLNVSSANKEYVSYNAVYDELTDNIQLIDVFKKLFGAELDLSENADYSFISLNGKLLESRFNRSNSYKISAKPKENIIFRNTTWTRNEAQNNPRSLYIFTDNTDRDSGSNLIDPNSPYAKKYGKNKHYPNTTQAVLRGLPNAMPISTQRWYHDGAKGERGRWTDKEANLFEQTIKEEIDFIIEEWNTGKYDNINIGNVDGLFNTKISNISKERTPKLYNILQKEINRLITTINGKLYSKSNTTTANEKVDYTGYEFYSGGAEGSDTIWGNLARKAGAKVKDYTPKDFDSLPNNWKQKLNTEYKEVVKYLNRKELDINSYAGKLVRRDMMQADKADSIFAVAPIIHDKIGGGTGYAATRGIIRGIPVYVFNTNDNSWYSWDYSNNKFVRSKQPTLTKHAAIIGTRNITKAGERAIYNVVNNIKQSSLFKDDNINYELAAYDLGMTLFFKQLKKITDGIEANAKCSNPDKFGAKASVAETRETLLNIKDILTNKDNIANGLININGIPFLQSIYPGIEQGDKFDFKVNPILSSYKSLATFLQFSTIPSVIANSQLLSLENSDYVNMFEEVQGKLGIRFTDEQRKEYTKYLVSSIYTSVEALNTPKTINEHGEIVDNYDLIEKYTSEQKSSYWNLERARIRGYRKVRSHNIQVKDFANPTKEELNAYCELTPLQKVLFVQTNFNIGKGIAEFLQTNTFRNEDTIRYYDQTDNIEQLFSSWNSTFFSKNPFGRLLALDLIKYAFVVEGFNYKKGGISKLITNRSMYGAIEQFGFDLINGDKGIVDMFNIYSNPNSYTRNDFIDKFVRSHPDLAKRVYRKKNDPLSECKFSDIFIIRENNVNAINQLKFTAEEPKGYITLVTNATDPRTKERTSINILYKVIKHNNTFILIPLNKLDSYETTEYSVNSSNNNYSTPRYYLNIAKSYLEGTDVNTILSTPKENPINLNIIDNTNDVHKILENLLTNTYAVNRQIVNNFITSIIDRVKNPVEGRSIVGYVDSNSSIISNIIKNSADKLHTITIDGEERTFKIIPIKMSPKIEEVIKNKDRWGESKMRTELACMNPHEARVAKEILDNNRNIKTSLYRVEEVVSENQIRQTQQDIADADNERAQNTMYSSVSYIGEDELLEVEEIDDLNNAILNDIENAERRLEGDAIIGDDAAKRFNATMRKEKISRFEEEIMHNNPATIINNAARYYERTAMLLNNIMNGISIDGEIYSISDPKLYEKLEDHPEVAEQIVKVLLEAKTFGRQILPYLNSFVIHDDETINTNVERIKNAINNVINNPKLIKGFENYYNIYVANMHSTNPMVKSGIVELRTAFGDIGRIEKGISDVGELDIAQIQAVVKSINNELTGYRKFNIPEAVNEFRKEYNRIESMPGELDMSKVVDEHGYLRRVYNEKYIEDKNRHNELTQSAKDEYEDARLSGNPIRLKEAAIKYYKTKLERDKWYAKNVEQPIVQSYYENLNNITEQVLATAPELYVEFMELRRELYDANNNLGIGTRAEMLRKKEILNKIGQLTSLFDEEFEPKSTEDKNKAKALSKFINDSKKLNDETFESNGTAEYEDKLEYYKNFISEYDARYPNRTLDQKLYDEKYFEAYNWIQENTVKELNSATKTAIFEAFAILGEDAKEVPDYIKSILNKPEYYDDNGKLNPTKISEEDIRKIKQATIDKYKKESNEDILLKNNNPVNKPIVNKAYKEELQRYVEEDAMSGTSEDYLEYREARIRAINNILEKVCKKGEDINPANLIDKLSIDELKELAKYYFELQNPIKTGVFTPSKVVKFLNENTNKVINEPAFNEAIAQINTITDKELKNIITRIFYHVDDNGNIIVDPTTNKPEANSEIYSYRVPKDKYRDFRKEKARKLINENVEYELIPAYHEAYRNAADKFQWYKDNHFFNPYTGKFEPLKIWKKMKVNPNGTLDATYYERPSPNNKEKTIKADKKNIKYKYYSANYNSTTGSYTDSSLTTKEEAMRKLFQDILDKNATTEDIKRKADKGFMPRRMKERTNAKWYMKQARGLIGIDYDGRQPEWTDDVTYEIEKDNTAPMMTILKQKGYKEIPEKPKHVIGQSEKEYNEEVKAWEEEKAKIEADNLKLDNEVLDRDWKSVFEDYITRAMDYNYRRQLKNTAQLLMEDLKQNKAYKVNFMNNLARSSKSSNQVDRYKTESFDNAYKVIENWYHRMFRDEFHEKHKLRPAANALQNMTSAKYMIFNVTGGIANIATGLANIMLEVEGRNYLDRESYNYALNTYIRSIPSIFSKLYSEQSTTLPVALMKAFDVVDFDAMIERRNEEGIYTKIQRIRNAMYSLQTGGEHFMQNTILLGILHSHRLYFNPYSNKWEAISFEQYTRQKEEEVFESIIADDKDMKTRFKNFKINIKSDINKVHKYVTLKKNIVQEFLDTYANKELKNKYIAAREEMRKTSKEKFNKLERVDEQFELVDGYAKIKEGSHLSKESWADIRNKVISINKKIHGVYDKIGAAYIEKLWYGSLIMQYHKHIWPGIMKRWRRKGYYNEARGSWEKGYYWSAWDFLVKPFQQAKEKRYGTEEENISKSEEAMRFIATVLDGGRILVTQGAMNYKTMPEWERANIRRCISEIVGITVGIIAAIAIHMGWDDDEIKESATLSTLLYQCDRLVSETSEYTGVFSYASIKTTYSRPIAALSAANDYYDLSANIVNYLIDDTYNPIYDKGQYKGESKIGVSLQKVIPAVRVYQRLTHISASNKKFSIGKNLLGFIDTRGIGYVLAGRYDSKAAKEKAKLEKEASRNSIFYAMD